jgi:hypothetical protein
MPQHPQQQTINVDLSKADDIKCKKCECPYFIEAIRVKRLSVLMSPTGREEYVNIPTLLCASCGEEFRGL